MKHRIWVDGIEGEKIPGDDPGLLLGLTVFETVRTYERGLFRLDQHLDRLIRSAEALDIPAPARALMEAEIVAAAGTDLRIRYTLTAGGHRILDVAPVEAAGIGKRMRVATMDWEPARYLPGVVKHGSRAAWMIAARRLDVDEVILIDHLGLILEANRSNVLAVVEGQLRTPPLDGRFLEGVTRGALLDAAATVGLSIVEASLPRTSSFEELYLISSLKELAPVIEWDGQPAAGDGPIGSALYAAFRDLVASETASASM